MNDSEEQEKKEEDEERYNQQIEAANASISIPTLYPAMPKEHGRTPYGTGYVYLDTENKHFRVILNNDRPRKFGSSLKWKLSEPCQAEWIRALQSIDNYLKRFEAQFPTAYA